MLNFGEFIVEGGYNVPTASIDKEKVDLDCKSTVNEINRNLASTLSPEWSNPYQAWIKISKLLSFYSITLPRTLFDDDEAGEEVVAISQFGDVFGASLDGTVTAPDQNVDHEHFLYFYYGISDNGFYKCFAVILDEEELNSLLDDDDSIDLEDEEGQVDPRQE